MSYQKELLFVDDCENDIELTLGALESIGLKERVVVARDGVEALEYFSGEGQFAGRGNPIPKLVLLDLKLPRINGMEVLKAIRENERLRDVPVVMLTSSREPRDVAEGYRLGINAFVVKPVNFKDFTDSVQQLGRFWMTVNEPPP